MRNVLIICPYYPPMAASGSHRMLGFTRHLPTFGWNTSVVAAEPVWSEPSDPTLAANVPAGASVMYVPFPEGRIANAVSRVLKKSNLDDGYCLWVRAAWKTCKRIVRKLRPDAILTSGPPHSVHHLGLRLKSRFGTPWIADFRDPWTWQNGPFQGMRRLERNREAAVLRIANVIVSNAPRACEELQRRFPQSAHKIIIITNGFDAESIPEKSPELDNRRIEILHAGELYAGRDPRPLLDALSNLRRISPELPTWHLTFLGRSEWSGLNLSDEIHLRGCDDVVTVAGYTPYETTKRRMVDADILLLLDTPGRRSGVPAKLYEYVGCNRPVLALAEVDSDTSWVLSASGLPHRLVKPGDVTAIGRALSDMLSNLKSTYRVCLGSGATMFTRHETARRLAATLDSVVRKSSSGDGLACDKLALYR